MELQAISIRAGKSSSSSIDFEVTNELGRRCVDKLNQFMRLQEGTITLAASSTGEPDKRDLCRQLIKLVMASDMREYDKTELSNFLACQSLKARKDAQLRQILRGR
jgi:hypothetical protein